MCGICLILVESDSTIDQYSCLDCLEHIGVVEPLRRRGPDHFGKHFSKMNDRRALLGAASVLHIRGTDHIARQPSIDTKDTDGSFLLYNGEIYGGLEGLEDGSNDTDVLFDQLKQIARLDENSAMLSFLSNLEGPFAIVFFDAPNQRLWFSRDAFGRRSLLYGIPPSSHSDPSVPNCKLVLSSVAGSNHINWTEFPAGYVCCLKFGSELGINDDLIVFQLRLSPHGQDYFAELRSQFGSFQVIDYESQQWKGLFHINKCEGPICPDQMDDDAFESWYLEMYLKEVQGFLSELRSAIGKRTTSISKWCHCHKETVEWMQCEHSKLAVLFSGGVDSLLLAVLLAEEGHSVDLLNVAFGDTPSQAPDRITGELAFTELQRLYPKPCQTWNFVRIDVDGQELALWRRRRIANLVRPLNTVLDDSIGCVLWFSARGIGRIWSNPDDTSYRCQNRVLFVGSGADELLAGYSRHRKRYSDMMDRADGRLAVINEMELELRRIGGRNLGRDDRTAADNGRETRLPYLDEQLVKYVNELPLEAKVDLHRKRGIGEKLLLRMALRKLGLKSEFYRLPKRAMQFGSRIAKAENRKEKGGDQCQRLVTNEDKE